MSFSINDLLGGIDKIKNIAKRGEDLLHNPDLPTHKDFDDLLEIKDMAYNAFKLTSQPRNGQALLPRTNFDDDPRKDSFMQENSIDPNVIRKKQNPDGAHPTLQGGMDTLFSLVPDNVVEHDYVSLISLAHKNYSNYKNRFNMPQQTPQQGTPNTGNGGIHSTRVPLPSVNEVNSKNPSQSGEDMNTNDTHIMPDRPVPPISIHNPPSHITPNPSTGNGYVRTAGNGRSYSGPPSFTDYDNVYGGF
jgi:hypothetical protein